MWQKLPTLRSAWQSSSAGTNWWAPNCLLAVNRQQLTKRVGFTLNPETPVHQKLIIIQVLCAVSACCQIAGSRQHAVHHRPSSKPHICRCVNPQGCAVHICSHHHHPCCVPHHHHPCWQRVTQTCTAAEALPNKFGATLYDRCRSTQPTQAGRLASLNMMCELNAGQLRASAAAGCHTD